MSKKKFPLRSLCHREFVPAIYEMASTIPSIDVPKEFDECKLYFATFPLPLFYLDKKDFLAGRLFAKIIECKCHRAAVGFSSIAR